MAIAHAWSAQVFLSINSLENFVNYRTSKFLNSLHLLRKSGYPELASDLIFFFQKDQTSETNLNESLTVFL